MQPLVVRRVRLRWLRWLRKLVCLAAELLRGLRTCSRHAKGCALEAWLPRLRLRTPRDLLALFLLSLSLLALTLPPALTPRSSRDAPTARCGSEGQWLRQHCNRPATAGDGSRPSAPRCAKAARHLHWREREGRVLPAKPLHTQPLPFKRLQGSQLPSNASPSKTRLARPLPAKCIELPRALIERRGARGHHRLITKRITKRVQRVLGPEGHI
ncbi:hypothetical protein T492DRAFT_22901 [Pavlovales sp. CCMP2436]|nr:hypothetical protein T492DRAFT_22901 [Pavlovales sp. CCMP2436]|mmetsp:Transcript_22465/g.57003  ORF Transcript_22465/g.57003 Transcript_22465/m.57003 type:complete len:213 (-) Transcript_22465:594-1232(-)